MAKSVNKVILVGNLGKDPEVKYTPGGMAVAKFSLATSFRSKDKTSGEWVDHTDWHNIVVWDKLAGIAGEYLKKGGKVYIEGRLKTDSWEDPQTKQKKYMTQVVATDLVLLGGRGEGGSGGGFGGDSARGGNASHDMDQRMPEPEHAAPISDDDIPF
jgi:single-strand DNA-binding protein